MTSSKHDLTQPEDRPRDEWVELFRGHEACFTPVLDYDEALGHPHNIARQAFVKAGGVSQPAPAPRYSASPTVAPSMAGTRDDRAVLRDLGFTDDEITALGH